MTSSLFCGPTETSSEPSSPASSESSELYPSKSLEYYRTEGALRQRWISNTTLPSDIPCYVPRTTITLEDLQCEGWKLKNNLTWRSPGLHKEFREWRDSVQDDAVEIELLEADPSMHDAIYRDTFLELFDQDMAASGVSWILHICRSFHWPFTRRTFLLSLLDTFTCTMSLTQTPVITLIITFTPRKMG